MVNNIKLEIESLSVFWISIACFLRSCCGFFGLILRLIGYYNISFCDYLPFYDISSIAIEVTRIFNGLFASSASLSCMTHSGSSTIWVIDSRATHHMTPNKSMFSYCIFPLKCTLVMATNGAFMPFDSISSINQSTWSLLNVLHVLHLFC